MLVSYLDSLNSRELQSGANQTIESNGDNNFLLKLEIHVKFF